MEGADDPNWKGEKRMRKITAILALGMLTMLARAAPAQVAACKNNAAPQCRDSQVISTSGGSINVYGNGALAGAFEEIIAGSPATVSIVIQGCADGGTCTTVANSIRSPTIAAPYAYYAITATWTGGTGVKVTVNTRLTTAALQGGGGGGGIGGTVSSPNVPYASAPDTLSDSAFQYDPTGTTQTQCNGHPCLYTVGNGGFVGTFNVGTIDFSDTSGDEGFYGVGGTFIADAANDNAALTATSITIDSGTTAAYAEMDSTGITLGGSTSGQSAIGVAADGSALIVSAGLRLGAIPGAGTAGVVAIDASGNLSAVRAPGLSIPTGTATFAGGTGITSVTCASGYSCNNTRGTLTIVAAVGATTGTIATVSFSAALSAAPDCSATQNGGSTSFGIGNSAPTTASFIITAGVSVSLATLTVHYQCQP
jgi:hypothetical protein